MKPIDKRKVIGTVIGIIFFISCLVYFTYAWYEWRSGNNTVNLTIKDSSVECTNGPSIEVKNIGPILSLKDGVKANFNIKNTGGEEINITLGLNITSISSSLRTDSFKWALLQDTTGTNNFDYSKPPLLSGNFSNLGIKENTLSSTIKVAGNSTYSFMFIVYIDGNMENSESMMSGSMKATITYGDCGTIKKEASLINYIKKDAVMDNTTSTYVTSSSGIDFNSISSDINGKGVYIRSGTENDNYPVYYYRGAVTNNNVLFGDFCWKIVRTTETGGIKLIYNGPQTNGSCNNTGSSTIIGTSEFNEQDDKSSYVGYMYNTDYSDWNDTFSTDVGGEFFDLNSIQLGRGEDITYKDNSYTLRVIGSGINTYNKYNAKYTCGTQSIDTCSYYYYIYYVDDETNKGYGIRLGDTSGKITLFNNKYVNKTSSTIATTIDNWMNSNLSEFAGNIWNQETWCYDRTIQYDSSNNKLYGPTKRISNGESPSLTCKSNLDILSLSGLSDDETVGTLLTPAGLLNTDEIRLAGGTMNTNKEYYLYNNTIWWTGSPAFFSDGYAAGFNVYSDGQLNNDLVDAAADVRPAISLRIDTTISSGDGSYTNPYVVK